MLSVPSAMRIFVYSQATDMRKQFNGLHAIVTHSMGQDVMTGDYFVFFNRRKHRCKILYWDHDGLVVWAKRLERGGFETPPARDDAITVEIDGTTLAMILGGVDLETVQRRKRYQAAPLSRATDDGRCTDGLASSCMEATV